MEQLVVRFGIIMFDLVYWVVWLMQDQDVIVSGELFDVSVLVSFIECIWLCKVLVLVLGVDVCLCQVDLLFKVNCKILNVILFMLEDELVDDISELFFVFGLKIGNQ